jgi:hypothetical protein
MGQLEWKSECDGRGSERGGCDNEDRRRREAVTSWNVVGFFVAQAASHHGPFLFWIFLFFSLSGTMNAM